ncbi:MAG: hypothetical protein ACI4W2_02750 [Eubacterium sp.]
MNTKHFRKINEENTQEEQPKVLAFLQKAGELLEIIAAAFMCIAVIIAFIKMVPVLQQFWKGNSLSSDFNHFIESMFTVVIGIEFLKMLCQPDAGNVLETLIFLVARHMIVTQTTPVQDLVSTISILLLLLMKRFIQDPGCFGKKLPGKSGRHRLEQKDDQASSESDKA